MALHPTSIAGSGITCLLIILCFNHQNGLSQANEIRKNQASHDSIRIKELFAEGNRFFDGPSDSLVYYYSEALALINSSLNCLTEADKNFSDKKFRALKKLEKEANIQLGIENLLQGNYDQSLTYYQQALAIAEMLEDVSAISECYGEIGTLYNNMGKYDQALDYQQKALEIAMQLADDDWVAICNNQIGSVYKKKAYYTLALKHYLEALQYFEATAQLRRVAAIYQNIGDIYYAQKNFEKAQDYYIKTNQISVETGNRQREADSYLLMGLVMTFQENYEAARNFIKTALKLYETLGYRHGMDDCYIALGNIWLQEKNWQEAEKNYSDALDIALASNNKTSIAEALIKLGKVHLKQNQFQQSEERLMKGFVLAEEAGSKELAMEASKILSELYEKSGNSLLALKHFRNYSVLKDSLFTDAQYRTISEMEAIYEASKKEQNIVLLSERNRVQDLMIHRRNRLLIITVVFFTTLLLLVYLYLMNTRLKARHKAVELENRLLRSQMNPHFIFNSLIAIQSYFYDQNPVKAGDFLAKFAELMRITLENSRAEFVLFEKELVMIRIYLELQALRFDNKFSFSITVDESIDASNFRIPPMLAQPFIENSIEHGLRNRADQGLLEISFRKNGNTITVSIKDNGIGREASKKYRKSSEHLSLAVPMIQERLEMMSKKFRHKFEMEINDLYDPDGKPAGTKVEITMPWQG